MARRQFSEAEKERFAVERREQLERWQAEIAVKVEALVDGQEWQRWLAVASRFHQYSFSNSVLIWLQRPDATAVAGYQAWKSSFGRRVNRGETGIRIFAPITRRVDQVKPDGSPVLDASGTPVRSVAVVAFKLASVFDVSQTSGPALAERPVPQLLRGQAPEGLWERLQGFVETQGFRVERGDCGGANGVTRFAENLDVVRPDVDDAQAVKTLAHEAGHVLLHSPQTDRGAADCRGRVEVEAESVGYLVTAAHGLDSSQYTFRYVAGWAESAQANSPTGTSLGEVISSTGSRVIKAADTILTATKPPQLVGEVLDGMSIDVTRGIHTDRAIAVGREAGHRRVPAGREQPLTATATSRSRGALSR